ncbi:MAG: histidine kinase N-terminal 7TM domain-containing protein [Chloroflexota bacterium]
MPGGLCFSLLMAAVAFYAAASAGEIASASTPARIAWSKLSYLGIVSVAPLWFLFAASYTGRSEWLGRFRLAALWVLPVAVLMLVATNEAHRLVWPEITPVSSEPGARLVYSHGPVVWLNAAYAYGLLLVGTVWLLQSAWRSPKLYRKQVATLTAAALVPWLANLLYLPNPGLWQGFDPTPLAFTLTGALIAWGIYRFQMLDLAPVAYQVLFDSIADGVLVLDRQDRLVDMNQVARGWLGLDENAIGQNVFEILPAEEALQAREPLEFRKGQAIGLYQLSVSPLHDARGEVQGRVALLHDVSREHALLEAEQRRARQMEMLNAITRAALGTPDLHGMLQILADRLGELFGADGAYLTLWDEPRQHTLPAAAYGPVRETYTQLGPKPGEKTITESVLEAGRVLVAEDVFNTPHMSASIAARFPTRSMMALPLIANEQKLGAAIVSFSETHRFTPEEIVLGELAATQVAMAVSKYRLLEIERQRSAQLAALQSISQAVVSSLELDQIFDTVVKVLHESFGYAYVSIYRLFGDKLYLEAQQGYPHELTYYEIPITRGIMGRTVRTRQAQFVADVSRDPDFLRAAYHVESEICVPLLKEETVLGTLNIEAPPERPLTETDLDLLTSFGSQVSVAIDNANLFQAERLQRELAEALREMSMTLSQCLDPQVVLDRLLFEIRRVVAYDTACVMLLDKERRTARITRLSGYEKFGEEIAIRTAALEFDLETTAHFRKIIASGCPLIVADTELDPDWKRFPEAAHIRSWIGAPILVRGQVIGFLSLDKIEPNFYGLEHAERLAAFASHAAIAIENARIFTEMQHLAIIDELTGLYNRRGFFELGRREVERAVRLNHPLTALFVDIDHFKQFNDTYSYAVGDQVLRQFAACLRDNLREIDLIGRYGGDEFVVLLPETNLPAAREIGERLRGAIAEAQVCTGRGETRITACIGVCPHSAQTDNLDTLLECAGDALHLTKQAGRNRVAVHPGE